MLDVPPAELALGKVDDLVVVVATVSDNGRLAGTDVISVSAAVSLRIVEVASGGIRVAAFTDLTAGRETVERGAVAAVEQGTVKVFAEARAQLAVSP